MKILQNLKKIVPSKFTILLVSSIILCLLLLAGLYKESQRADTNEDLVKALTDTVTIYKTREGKNAAKTRIIVATNRRQAIEIAKVRNASIALQLERNKNIVSITEFSTVTRIDTVVKVNNIIRPEDEKINFSRVIKNQYYDAQIAMKEDSLALGIQVYNKQTVSHIEEPQGFFKPDKYVVEVVNDNPYTVVTGLSTYEIKPKKKKLFLKGALFGAAAVVGGLILIK